MGAFCGKIESRTVDYDIITLVPTEIRTYAACFVAEIQCTDFEMQEASSVLMEYIGKFGTPKNVKGKPPGLLVPLVPVANVPIPQLLPMLREDTVLQILLPQEYTAIDQVLVPTDGRVVIRSLPERTVAMLTFHGTAKRAQYMPYVRNLRATLDAYHMLGGAEVTPAAHPLSVEATSASKTKHSEVLSTPASGPAVTSAYDTIPNKDAASDGGGGVGGNNMNKWTVAQYHSHATLFCLRKNEVWIELADTNQEVAKLQAAALLSKL